jgi:hypothetical protein
MFCDQFVYKTKDNWKNDIYQYTSEKDFEEIAVRVVRYTREDKHEAVLQDSGNEQPITVGEATRTVKKGTRSSGK